MKSYRQLVDAERGRFSILQGWAPEKLSNPKLSSLNTYRYEQHYMDSVDFMYVYMYVRVYVCV